MSACQRLTAAGFVVALLLPGHEAVGGSQILGVVATNGARPMQCRGGECVAYLSSFCIQRERDVPSAGASYRLAASGDGVSLVVTTAAGRTLRLSGADDLRFTSFGSFSAVRASLPEARLGALDAVSVAIEIDERATLIPDPVSGDPDPLTAQEIALATGPLRAAAAPVFDRPGTPASDAARLTGALINALPERGRVSPAERDGLWDRVAVGEVVEGLSEAGLARAHLGYRACRARVARGAPFSTRSCLEVKHEHLMLGINAEYWTRLGGV